MTAIGAVAAVFLRARGILKVFMTTTSTQPSISFAEMGLADSLLNSINTLGYTQPTAVQAALVPSALQGGDWIVASQTGSGKTMAFLLPAVQKIVQAMTSGKNNPSNAPMALVLCPTRELAQQVATDAINLVKGTRGIRVATIVGGTSYFKQKQGLKGAQLVVATPGRLLDWVQQGGISLAQLQTLVLDEADRMLDLGFSDEINAIADACEHREQTLMFSATFTPRETRLAGNLMVEPQQIMLASVQEKHENITQHLHWADNSHHQHQLLLHWLADPKLDQAVVFASTQVDTERLADELVEMGISAASLHGAMPQMVRNRRLDSLRKGRIRVLVATDVAARGIDVPTITHVFNYGLPMKAEDYVQRIGRTGRAGRDGVAVTFAQHEDSFKIRQIERYISRRIDVTQIKGLEPQISHEDFKANQVRKKGRGQRGFGSADKAGGRGSRPSRPRQQAGGFNDSENRGYAGRDNRRQDPEGRRESAPREGAQRGAPAGGESRFDHGQRRDAVGFEHRPRREHHGKANTNSHGKGFAGSAEKPHTGRKATSGDKRGAPQSRAAYGDRSSAAKTGAKPRAQRKPSF